GLNEAYKTNASSEGEELQVFLARPDSAYVGVGPASTGGLHDVGIDSGHLGGFFSIPESKEPPSRAYLKLSEALLLVGWEFKKTETVLDLAASPGGWTWVAAQQGAKVYAVDRAELAPKLMEHPRVRFLKGDVFQFSPSAYPHWIICDVISEPDKSLELLRKVLADIAPERIIWTLKFKKEIQFQILNLVDEILSEYSYLVRHLRSNKNEVTVMIDTRHKRKG
ncbi:MAG: hypothetical protein K2X47_18180, partial [Bdellovibrionales bacterium]|nr:hypothetical protein [Bdellovibrionales bacterium]